METQKKKKINIHAFAGENTRKGVKKKINLISLLIWLLPFQIFAQTYTIPLRKDLQTGLNYVKASISGMDKSFIFDTGASSIVINSAVFAELLKAKKINSQDIIGTGASVVANGATVTVKVLRVRNFKIGNFLIPQIEVVVMPDPQAPLLIGQSVFSQFGKITIDNAQNTITLEKSANTNDLANLKEVKLIKCFANSEGNKTAIENLLKQKINPNVLNEEANLPQKKATDRLKCEITIRYFANQDHQTAKAIENWLSVQNQTVCTENMTPYFNQEIPNYIEIWIK